ncbi:hypothetical protein ACFWWM_34600 [Streptomyces sp. NPDC058682]
MLDGHVGGEGGLGEDLLRGLGAAGKKGHQDAGGAFYVRSL